MPFGASEATRSGEPRIHISGRGLWSPGSLAEHDTGMAESRPGRSDSEMAAA